MYNEMNAYKRFFFANVKLFININCICFDFARKHINNPKCMSVAGNNYAKLSHGNATEILINSNVMYGHGSIWQRCCGKAH